MEKSAVAGAAAAVGAASGFTALCGVGIGVAGTVEGSDGVTIWGARCAVGVVGVLGGVAAFEVAVAAGAALGARTCVAALAG